MKTSNKKNNVSKNNKKTISKTPKKPAVSTYAKRRNAALKAWETIRNKKKAKATPVAAKAKVTTSYGGGYYAPKKLKPLAPVKLVTGIIKEGLPTVAEIQGTFVAKPKPKATILPAPVLPKFKTVVDLFDDQSQRWTKNVAARTVKDVATLPTSPLATKFSLWGAITRVYGTAYLTQLAQVTKVIEQYSLGKFKRTGGISSVMQFNNDQETSFQDVTRVARLAGI